MTQRMQRIARIIVEGLALSAQATAWREGMPGSPMSGGPARSAPPIISETYSVTSFRRPRIQ